MNKTDEKMVKDFYIELRKTMDKICLYCKDLRKDKGFTRKDFSKLTKIPVQTLYNFENCKVCKVEYILSYRFYLCSNENENDDFVMTLVDFVLENKYLRGNKTRAEHMKELKDTFKEYEVK